MFQSSVPATTPYYDGAAAVDSLCRKLGLPDLFVHAHKHGCVEGLGAQSWPRGGNSRVRPARLEVFEKGEWRRLHAKAFEMLCKRGRIVVSVSANGTAAALVANRNVEARVVHLQRRRAQGCRLQNGRALGPGRSAGRGTGRRKPNYWRPARGAQCRPAHGRSAHAGDDRARNGLPTSVLSQKNAKQ